MGSVNLSDFWIVVYLFTEIAARNNWLSVPCSMEIVWHGKYNQLFASFPHLWQLKPTDGVVQQATIFNDSAKVRFLCKVTIPYQPVY